MTTLDDVSTMVEQIWRPQFEDFLLDDGAAWSEPGEVTWRSRLSWRAQACRRRLAMAWRVLRTGDPYE